MATYTFSSLCWIILLLLPNVFPIVTSFVTQPTSLPPFLTSWRSFPYDTIASCDWDTQLNLVNCTDRNLTSIPVDIPTDVEILYLSVNIIFTIYEYSFANLTELRELHADHGQINTIESSSFDDLEHLEVLNLYGNSLYSLPDNLFARNLNIKDLNLGRNEFNEIPCTTLLPLTNLKSLHFHLNNIQNPHCDRFPTLTNNSLISFAANNIQLRFNSISFSFLENSTSFKLSLAANSIEVLRYPVVKSLKVKELDLSFNPMRESGVGYIFIASRKHAFLQAIYLRKALVDHFVNVDDTEVFKYLGDKALGYLDISLNNMATIPASLRNRAYLRNISLAENNIQHFTPSDVSGMTGLEGLNLKQNGILELSSLKWNNTRLRVLNLAQNRLTRVPSRAFVGLGGLATLDLSSNPMKFLDKESFSGLQNLSTLDLSHSKLGQLQMDCLRHVPNLMNLFLRDAQLAVLFNAFPDFSRMCNKLQVIDLSDNDIKIYDIWSDYYRASLFSGKLFLQEINLDNNQHINEIPRDTFQNLTKLSKLSIRNNGLTNLDPKLFVDLSSLEYLYFDRNAISDLNCGTFSPLHNLKILSGDQNAIVNVDRDLFSTTSSLKHITLSNNGITVLSDGTFSHLRSLKYLDMRGNPFACTCALAPFSDGLKVTNVSLVGSSSTLCSPASFDDLIDKPIAEFNPSAYCGPNIALLVTTPLLAVLCVISMGFAYYYRYRIRYHLFLLKLRVVGHRLERDEREQDDYQYFLNVMYADGDAQWVDDHLKPVVRAKYPHKIDHADIVYGDDDLLPGMYFLTAIDDVIINSYKTVLLLSHAAIRDEWFTTKFRIALEHVNESRFEKVVIIFLEKIENDQLPFLVRIFLSKNKPYLRWTDDEVGRQYFWEQFAKSLETNVRRDDTIPL